MVYSQKGSHFQLLLSIIRLITGAVLLVLILFVLVLRYYPAPDVYPAFPKIAHTAKGAAGDPVNVLIIGSKTQVSDSFARAGWLVPDPITTASSARIALDSLEHRAYPTAPVSNLYVFGRIQDLAFELPTNDVQIRGHIRLWLTTTHMHGEAMWLGAATYDHGIELNGRTGIPTHHILPAVDLERDAVGNDLERTGSVIGRSYDPYTSPIWAAYNGGGDYYASDGQVLMLNLANTSLPAPSGLDSIDAMLDRGLFHVYGLALTTASVATVLIFIGVAMLAFALWPVIAWLWRHLLERIQQAGDFDQS